MPLQMLQVCIISKVLLFEVHMAKGELLDRSRYRVKVVNRAIMHTRSLLSSCTKLMGYVTPLYNVRYDLCFQWWFT